MSLILFTELTGHSINILQRPKRWIIEEIVRAARYKSMCIYVYFSGQIAEIHIHINTHKYTPPLTQVNFANLH